MFNAIFHHLCTLNSLIIGPILKSWTELVHPTLVYLFLWPKGVFEEKRKKKEPTEVHEEVEEDEKMNSGKVVRE